MFAAQQQNIQILYPLETILFDSAVSKHLAYTQKHQQKNIDETRSVQTYNNLLLFGHVDDQVNHTGTVTPFVVIPRDKLDEVIIQGNSSLGIKDT